MADLTHRESKRESSTPKNEFFNDRWHLYQKILIENYMEHREIYCVLREFLASYLQKPFKMLDLGCGDANFTAGALIDTNITFYQGVDLSEAALEIACNNMAKLPCQKMFVRGNFFEIEPELVTNQRDRFDVILASFALHHLTLKQKDAIMERLIHLLKANGVFLLIDVVRRKGEEREAYIKRYLENVRQYWSSLTLSEILTIEEHISSSDFPETQETLRLLALKHSFTNFECLYRDSLDTSQVLVFYK
jgi:ubiquinone/menaquinone biosynthesis C-methylase UbiE